MNYTRYSWGLKGFSLAPLKFSFQQIFKTLDSKYTVVEVGFAAVEVILGHFQNFGHIRSSAYGQMVHQTVLDKAQSCLIDEIS